MKHGLPPLTTPTYFLLFASVMLLVLHTSNHYVSDESMRQEVEYSARSRAAIFRAINEHIEADLEGVHIRLERLDELDAQLQALQNRMLSCPCATLSEERHK